MVYVSCSSLSVSFEEVAKVSGTLHAGRDLTERETSELIRDTTIRLSKNIVNSGVSIIHCNVN